MLGAGSLTVFAQTVVIVSGKILEVGVAEMDGSTHTTRTLTVLIDNDDRVFRIKSGTAVKYAISDSDAELAEVGSRVQLLVSYYSTKARVLSLSPGSTL